jgi:hypothetical protein
MLRKHVHPLSIVMGLDGETIRSDPFAGLWETKLGTSFGILDNKALDRFDKPFHSINTMAHKQLPSISKAPPRLLPSRVLRETIFPGLVLVGNRWTHPHGLCS